MLKIEVYATFEEITEAIRSDMDLDILAIKTELGKNAFELEEGKLYCYEYDDEGMVIDKTYMYDVLDRAIEETGTIGGVIYYLLEGC